MRLRYNSVLPPLDMRIFRKLQKYRIRGKSNLRRGVPSKKKLEHNFLIRIQINSKQINEPGALS